MYYLVLVIVLVPRLLHEQMTPPLRALLDLLPQEVLHIITMYLLPVIPKRTEGMTYAFVGYTAGIPVRGVVFEKGFRWEYGVVDGVFVSSDGPIKDPLLVSRDYPEPYPYVPFLQRQRVLRVFV